MIIRWLMLTALAVAWIVPASADSVSWYSAGARTANGARFDPNGLTCAHRSLPFGTRVRVSNIRTGRSVVCVVNDRGPFIRGRSLDLARGAFARIAPLSSGVIRATWSVVR